MLPVAVTIIALLVLCAIAATILHRRHPHTKVETEPVYEPDIADFSWGRQQR